MIATTRGLAVLAAIAIALWIATLIAGRGDRSGQAQGNGAATYLLVPSFDEKQVNEISFTWGQANDHVRRVGDHWLVDDRTRADPATIDAIFTALRGARFHRRAPRSSIHEERRPHGPSGIRLGSISFHVGPSLAGLDQTWLVRGDDAYLVDDWVVHALVPGPLALRVRHPIDCASADKITATTAKGRVRIEGRRLVEPHAMWIEDEYLKGLGAACSAIELQSLDGRSDGRQGLHIVADGELTEAGRCSEQRYTYIEAPWTRGCVDTEALRALDLLLQRLIVRPQDSFDMRPLPIDSVKLTLADGTNVDLDKQPRVGDQDADPDQVRALLAALEKQRGPDVADRPTGKPRGIIKAVDRAGTEVTLELYDHVIARPGEPRAIPINDDDWAVITRPSSALRDATRWREDATTISSITLDNITYKRGAVLGEWTREPAGKVDPTLVDALVESIATLRAPTAPPPAAIAHRLRITITPPAGAPVTHTLDLAAPTGQGCAARVDNAPMLLPLPVCTAVIALASSR